MVGRKPVSLRLGAHIHFRGSWVSLCTFIAFFALVAPSLTSYATPPSDPICSVQSSLVAVEKVRAAMAARRGNVGLLSARPAAQGPPPTLAFAGWETGNLPRLWLAGAAGGT